MKDKDVLIIVWYPLKLEQKIIVLLFLFLCFRCQILLLLWWLALLGWYGDNTVEELSGVFSLIRMC